MPSQNWKGVTSNKFAYSLEYPTSKSFLCIPKEQEQQEIPLDADVGRAIDYLNRWKEGDKPFFLYLPLNMPHPPYDICEPFYHMYDPTCVGADLMKPLKGKPSYETLIREYRGLNELPQDVFETIYAVYLGMVSYVDYLAGEIDKTLQNRDLEKNTVFIISSDHGDWHGTRRLVEKWPNAMDDEMIHVPLIIRLPGGARNHVVKEQTELFDIMATVMEVAGIEKEHDHFAKSLIKQLYGEAGDPTRAVFCEGGYDVRELHCFEGYSGRQLATIVLSETAMKIRDMYAPKRTMQQEHPDSVCRTSMIRTLQYKLVRRSNGEHELYDLVADPAEIVNLYYVSQYSEIRTKLELQMLDWYQTTSDTVPYKEDFRLFGK